MRVRSLTNRVSEKCRSTKRLKSVLLIEPPNQRLSQYQLFVTPNKNSRAPSQYRHLKAQSESASQGRLNLQRLQSLLALLDSADFGGASRLHSTSLSRVRRFKHHQTATSSSFRFALTHRATKRRRSFFAHEKLEGRSNSAGYSFRLLRPGWPSVFGAVISSPAWQRLR